MIISPLNCRQILAARSDYFRAMFSHNVAENIQNKVIIEDMDPVTFKRMVNFMYTIFSQKGEIVVDATSPRNDSRL